MKKIKMMERLIDRIKSCHKQLMSAKANRYIDKIYVEGFRCRLDELILYYMLVRDVSFCEACKELDINYNDVDVSGDEQ